MSFKVGLYRIYIVLLLPAVFYMAGCSTTRHIPDGQYLLRKNKISLKTDNIIYNKGEMRDNLLHLALQKLNTKPFGLPAYLWFYNLQYKKLHNKPDSALSKLVERPVIYDSALAAKSIVNMKSYLFNQGFLYARIKDTVVLRHKKARVTYKITTGFNYLINKVNYNIDDSAIAKIVAEAADDTRLVKNKMFTFGLPDEERSRITAIIRNNGYYQFTQDNIRFVLDTMDKVFLRDVENPLENAINFISSAKTNKKPTTDIEVIIRTEKDSANIPYHISKVDVYPDYGGGSDLQGVQVMEDTVDGIIFRYHERYVHYNVLADRIFLRPGQLYAQADYDKTIVKLNELGIFQYIRIQPIEDRRDSTLSCNIYLSRNKKYDFNANIESSSGSTYQLGSSAALSFRNKNFEKGANLLTVSLNGGVELSYSGTQGKNFIDHFGLLTEYYGLNASLDLPKFLAPIPSSLFDNTNLPHTIISGGTNVIDRVQYFTLINTSAGYKYNWRPNKAISWDFSPAFMNIIRLPRETDTFRKDLDNNAFLKDSYKQDFIEGENLTFSYSDFIKKQGRNYFRLKISFEEAGGVLGGLNSLGYALNDLFKIKYAQYTKFDFDAQRFVSLPHSVVALRFFGGVGMPYGQSVVLPYIKQYYVGGPYSLRGWPIRSLGPGSYYDPTGGGTSNTLDRTGDIKLEFNAEYRFPITPLFAGNVKLNGALFTDAGNIWLARKDSSTVGGEFDISKLGQDIAMDVGAGARFEIVSFLTLRFDVAIPVKKPYLPNNYGWVWDKIDFADPTWRANNVVVNLSIGYPF